jgi:type II restriction enzyme
MTTKIISDSAIKRRSYWIEEIKKLSGKFNNDYERLASELKQEVKTYGVSVLKDHLRLCGDIPESYSHDSSEEKLYSKYTDALLAEAYQAIGFRSIVLTERADAADVEAFAKDFSFVADAKSFRLSRTAKNQKDFKVQAMDGWKRGKPYAMVVCPIYQLPTKSSQIYQQASTRNVCIFTYSHLAMLVEFAHIKGSIEAVNLLHEILKVTALLNPSKDASQYWIGINRTMLNYSPNISKLWEIEKQVAVESISIAKKFGLTFLAQEREKIMRLSHEEALSELVRVHKIESRIRVINSLSDNGILRVI